MRAFLWLRLGQAALRVSKPRCSRAVFNEYVYHRTVIRYTAK